MLNNNANRNNLNTVMSYVAADTHVDDVHGGYYSDYPIIGHSYYIRVKYSDLYLTSKDALPYPLLAEKPFIQDNPYQIWTVIGSGSNPGCYLMNKGNNATITSSLVDPELYVLGMNDLVTQFWLFGLVTDKSTYALGNMRGDVIRLMTCPEPSEGEDMYIVDYTSGNYTERQLYVFEDV